MTKTFQNIQVEEKTISKFPTQLKFAFRKMNSDQIMFDFLKCIQKQPNIVNNRGTKFPFNLKTFTPEISLNFTLEILNMTLDSDNTDSTPEERILNCKYKLLVQFEGFHLVDQVLQVPEPNFEESLKILE